MPFVNLEYFKKKILEERNRVLNNIKEINEDLARIVAEDNIDDLEDLAELEMENERDKAILKSLKEELKKIDEVLKKIKEKKYAIDKSGNPIPINELLKNPLIG